MTADLCLATTAHPWYLGWAAFALPLFPYAFMTYWTGAGFLSYLAYAYHPVYEPAWVLLLEYIPVYGLMAWEIRKQRPMMMACSNGEKCGRRKSYSLRFLIPDCCPDACALNQESRY